MSKKDWQHLPTGSAEKVILHAEWAKSRGHGRAPSMSYGGNRNPRQALVAAKRDFNLFGGSNPCLDKHASWNVRVAAIQAIAQSGDIKPFEDVLNQVAAEPDEGANWNVRVAAENVLSL